MNPFIPGLFLLFLFAPNMAQAACTGPEGDAGTILYNTDHNVMQYCNDSNWVAMGGGGEGSAGVETDMIAAFDAAECPEGWSEVTDLHNRMIIGAGDSYNLGDTGGAASVTLSAAQMPSHNHSVNPPNTSTNTTGAHTHGYAHRPGGTLTGVGTSGLPPSSGNKTTSAGNHSHTVNIPAFNSGSAGSGQAHENRPPYRAYTMCKFDGEGSPSLREYKEQIADLSFGLDTLMKLRPVEYVWIEDKGGYPDTGFIAEDVAALSPVLADYNAKGELTGVKYDHLTALLTRAVQELKAENDNLRAIVVEQGREIEAIKDRLDAEDGQ